MKSLIISFAGYPFTPSSLMLDNGLAILASSLLDAGHECTILDYGTVECMERLNPGHYGNEVFDASQKLMSDLKAKGTYEQKDLDDLVRLEKLISKRQEKAVDIITEELSTYIKDNGIGMAGFKLWNGDGLSGSAKIAEKIRQDHPNITLIGGGPQVDYFLNNIYDVSTAFDALVYGEGEETIQQLAEFAEGKKTLESIPNLVLRKDGKDILTRVKRIDDLDALPTATYNSDIYLAMKGDDKIKVITIDESRGCPYGKCSFCIQPFKSGARLRKRSPEKIVDEMEKAINDYNISVFRYAGSATPPKHAKAIADEILRRDLDVEYTMFCLSAGYKKKDFKKLKESGLYAVFFGGESGSWRQLKNAINKHIKPKQLKNSIRYAKEEGIFTIASFIFPTPGETDKTMEETLELIREARPDSVPIIPPGVIPNTDWAKNPEKYGISLNDDYIEEFMKLKIKLLFPAILWPNFPYKICGEDSHQFTARSAKFSQEVENMGITTFLSDELKILSEYSNIAPDDYKRLTQEYIIKGDHANLQDIVKITNKNIEKKVKK